MSSHERKLLQRVIKNQYINDSDNKKLRDEITELLAQPELSTDSLQLPEQEPVAWITEWVQRYRYDGTPIIDRRVSFTKGNVPSLVPNHIPLYASPSKREPLSENTLRHLFAEEYCSGGNINTNFARAIEKAHGI